MRRYAMSYVIDKCDIISANSVLKSGACAIQVCTGPSFLTHTKYEDQDMNLDLYLVPFLSYQIV